MKQRRENLVRIALVCILAVMVSTCGSKSEDTPAPAPKCSHSIIGSWTGVSGSDKITLGSDESFAYQGDDGCKTAGTYSCPSVGSTSGTLKVTIKTADLSNKCLTAGDYTCAFQLANEQLSYLCGNDTITSAARVYKR